MPETTTATSTSALAEPAVPPEDFQEYQEFRRRDQRGEAPPEKAEEKPSAAAVKPPEAEGPPKKEEEPLAKTAEESETKEEEEQEEEGEPQPKKKGGFRRRIDRLTREKSELEGRVRVLEELLVEKPADETLAEAAAKPAVADVDREPQPEDAQFQDKADPYGEWLKTWSRWDRRHEAAKVAESERKMEAAEAYRTQKRAWDGRLSALREKTPDYDEKMDAVADVELPAYVDQAIFESEVGPGLAYHLAGNRAELERIVGLSPVSAVRELGKIEARLKPTETPASEKKTQTPAPVAPKVTNAPKPIVPVGGSAAGETPSVMDGALAADYTAWERARRAQLKR